jgi:hypothetical protein
MCEGYHDEGGGDKAKGEAGGWWLAASISIRPIRLITHH